MKILGISGSLRKGSFNTQLLNLVKDIAGDAHDFEIVSIADIPLYNQDVQDAGFPESVQALGAKVAAADALYICTPEYNWGVPGVLKNSVDWLSRLKPMPIGGKVIGLAGAAGGMLGTATSQAQLLHTLTLLGADVVIRPQVLVAKAHEAMQEPSDFLKDLIGKQLDALAKKAG